MSCILTCWRKTILIEMLSEIFLVIDDFGEPGGHKKITEVREL
jgi:hypothetical protein